MTNRKSLTSVLDDMLLQDFIVIEEYQDKYFFIKRIEENFPAINEGILYEALKRTNNFFGRPIKKRLFIDKFANEIYKMIT